MGVGAHLSFISCPIGQIVDQSGVLVCHVLWSGLVGLLRLRDWHSLDARVRQIERNLVGREMGDSEEVFIICFVYRSWVEFWTHHG